MLMHVCRVKNNGTDEPSSRAGTEMPTENGHVGIAGEGEGGMNREVRFDTNTLPCVKQLFQIVQMCCVVQCSA